MITESDHLRLKLFVRKCANWSLFHFTTRVNNPMRYQVLREVYYKGAKKNIFFFLSLWVSRFILYAYYVLFSSISLCFLFIKVFAAHEFCILRWPLSRLVVKPAVIMKTNLSCNTKGRGNTVPRHPLLESRYKRKTYDDGMDNDVDFRAAWNSYF